MHPYKQNVNSIKHMGHELGRGYYKHDFSECMKNPSQNTAVNENTTQKTNEEMDTMMSMMQMLQR